MMTDDLRTDTQLVAAFMESRDQAAFEQIVRRYEGLVFSVCSRVLRDHQDVRDASQATFLVLAIKCGSLDSKRPLAPWLHHIAYQIAIDLLRSRQARKARENKAIRVPEPSVEDAALREELRGLLDQELDNLPEKYRQPLVLFHLEGRSLSETAVALGRPVGTIGTWLSRGREMLRNRLVRRGLTGASVAVFGSLIFQRTMAEGSDAAFVAWTAKAAGAAVAGVAGAGGFVSAQVLALAKSALRALFLAKLKIGAVVAASIAASLILILVAGLGRAPSASKEFSSSRAGSGDPKDTALGGIDPSPEIVDGRRSTEMARETQDTRRTMPETAALRRVESTAFAQKGGASSSEALDGRIYRERFVALESAMGKIEGTYLTYVPNVDCITCWQNRDARVTWSFEAPASGKYAVVVTCVHGNGPSEYVVTLGDQQVTGAIVDRGVDPGWFDYGDDTLGTVELVRGKTYKAALQVTAMPNGFPMNFRRVTLLPMTSD